MLLAAKRDFAYLARIGKDIGLSLCVMIMKCRGFAAWRFFEHADCDSGAWMWLTGPGAVHGMQEEA